MTASRDRAICCSTDARNRFIINKGMVIALVNRKQGHGLEFSEVREFLGINEQALVNFLWVGVIETLHAHKYLSRVSFKLICPKSVERFDREYVSLKKLSLEKGLHYVGVYKQLGKRFVRPFFDGKYASRIYARVDVERF